MGNESATVKAEMAVIGIMLLEPEKTKNVFETLTAKMFISEQLGIIFNCCKKLTQQGERADAVSLLNKLGDDYKETVMLCAETVPSIKGFETYVNSVLDNWRIRTIKNNLFKICDECNDPDDITDQLKGILQTQEKIIEHQMQSSNKNFKECIMDFLKWMQKPDTSIKTGYDYLDRTTGGLQRGCVTVITARPGCGKTTLGLQIACNVATKLTVLYISLEMTNVQITRNVVSRFARVNSQKISNKELTEEDEKDISFSADYLHNKMKLIINDNPRQTVNDIEDIIKKTKPDLVVIDHIRLLTPLDERKKEFEASADNTHALKRIAKDYNINIIELVQAKREAQGRMPGMSDLYGGAATEQDADMVIGINPESEYEKMETCSVEIGVTKNRHGSGGTFDFIWERPFCSFCETDNTME